MKRNIFNVTLREWQDLTVMNTSADSPMGSIGPGRSLILSVIVWVAR